MLKHTPLKEPCVNQRRDVNIIKETPLKRCRYQVTNIFYNNVIASFKFWKNILNNSSLTKYGFSNFENKDLSKS